MPFGLKVLHIDHKTGQLCIIAGGMTESPAGLHPQPTVMVVFCGESSASHEFFH